MLKKINTGNRTINKALLFFVSAIITAPLLYGCSEESRALVVNKEMQQKYIVYAKDKFFLSDEAMLPTPKTASVAHVGEAPVIQSEDIVLNSVPVIVKRNKKTRVSKHKKTSSKDRLVLTFKPYVSDLNVLHKSMITDFIDKEKSYKVSGRAVAFCKEENAIAEQTAKSRAVNTCVAVRELGANCSEVDAPKNGVNIRSRTSEIIVDR